MTDETKAAITALVAVIGTVSALSMIAIMLTEETQSTTRINTPISRPDAIHVRTRAVRAHATSRFQLIDWCYAHHGVPAMAFTHDRSNVLCLKPEAVIALPREDAGR